jgi:hypothetical protein
MSVFPTKFHFAYSISDCLKSLSIFTQLPLKFSSDFGRFHSFQFQLPMIILWSYSMNAGVKKMIDDTLTQNYSSLLDQGENETHEIYEKQSLIHKFLQASNWSYLFRLGDWACIMRRNRSAEDDRCQIFEAVRYFVHSRSVLTGL